MLSKKGMAISTVVILVIAILILLWTTGALGWLIGVFSGSIKDCKGECLASCGTYVEPFPGQPCYQEGQKIEGTKCCLTGKTYNGSGGGTGTTDPTASLQIRWGTGSNSITADTTISAFVGNWLEFIYWARGKDAKECRVRYFEGSNVKSDYRQACIPSDFNAVPPNVVGKLEILPKFEEIGKQYTLEISLVDTKDKPIIIRTIKLLPIQCPMFCNSITQTMCGDAQFKTTCSLDCSFKEGVCSPVATT